MQDPPFFKFPTTPYLIAPSSISHRREKILSLAEANLFLSESVYIEEKIDGANLGISFTKDGELQLQNRGHLIISPFVSQWSPLSSWLKKNINGLFDALLDRFILFGEWCYYSHSIYYNALPDWFISFDVFDKQNKIFLSVKARNELISQVGLPIVPFIYSGFVSVEMLDHMIGQSAFGDEISEGLYLRTDSANQLKSRAKYVRRDFSQNIETHWSKKPVRKNHLRSSNDIAF